MTLEEAQAKILELQEENTKLTNERDSLSQDKTQLTEELDSVKKLNQQYFNKLSQQFFPAEEKDDKEDQEVQSCEEFAKSLNII